VKSRVITLHETPDRRDACAAHLSERSHPFEFFYGVNAATWGLTTLHPYEKDHPGSGYIMPQKHVGLHLSHWILWNLFAASAEGDSFSVMEDDVHLASDWKPRVEHAEACLPADWDICLLGHCNALDKPRHHVNGTVFKVAYPQCTHWYLVRRKALATLIETQRKVWAPIDLALIFGSYPQLNVYTVIPRLAQQFGIQLAE